MLISGAHRVFLFTCDAEWVGEDTGIGLRSMAQFLDSYGVRGTFFCTFDLVQKCPDVLKDLVNNGHEVASHGYKHSWFEEKNGRRQRRFLDVVSDWEIKEEIENSYKCFQEAGFSVKGFRAPALRIDDRGLAYVGDIFEYDSSCVQNKVSYDFSGRDHTEAAFPSLFRLPISRLNLIRVPFGSPYLLTPWPVLWPIIRHHLRKSSFVCFYSHSYDLIRMKPLHTDLKKILLSNHLYYNRCGSASTRRFYARLLSESIREGYAFSTCAEIAKLVGENKIPFT